MKYNQILKGELNIDSIKFVRGNVTLNELAEYLQSIYKAKYV